MKKVFYILIIFVFHNINAQEEITIEFSYDKSGSLTERKVQVYNLSKFSKPNLLDEVVTKQSSFKVSPNPTSVLLNIEKLETTSPDVHSIELTTLSGQIIQKIELNNTSINPMDVSNVKSGLYLLVIQYINSDQEVHKIIIND